MCPVLWSGVAFCPTLNGLVPPEQVNRDPASAADRGGDLLTETPTTAARDGPALPALLSDPTWYDRGVWQEARWLPQVHWPCRHVVYRKPQATMRQPIGFADLVPSDSWRGVVDRCPPNGGR